MSEFPQYFSPEWWQIFLAGIATLAIYTFLYKENVVYRFYEHVFIGIGTGFWIVYGISSFLWPKVFSPLLGYNRILFPDGTYNEAYDMRNLLWLLPISFGMLYYCILTKRHKWLAQLVIGCQLGYAAGFAFKGTMIEMLPQVFDTFKPLYSQGSFTDSFTNIFFVMTFVCTLTYFFFTFRPKADVLGASSSQLKLWFSLSLFGLIILASTFAAEYLPQKKELPSFSGVFAIPIAFSLAWGYLLYCAHQGTLSKTMFIRVETIVVCFASAFTVALFLSVFNASLLLSVPSVNLAAVLTLASFFFYFLYRFAPGQGGVVAVSSGIGRWLMMGCFGAFFGSTIMARMTILVERLEFLITTWAPTVF